MPLLFALCSLSAHAQISLSEQGSLLSLLQRARSERLSIEQRFSAVVSESVILRETLRELTGEHEQQRSLWSEQRAFLSAQLEALGVERQQLARDLKRADDSIAYWQTLSSEFEDFRSAAEAGRRSAFLRGAGVGVLVGSVGAVLLLR